MVGDVVGGAKADRRQVELEDRRRLAERGPLVADGAIAGDDRIGAGVGDRLDQPAAILEARARPGIERVVDGDDDGAPVGGKKVGFFTCRLPSRT